MATLTSTRVQHGMFPVGRRRCPNVLVRTLLMCRVTLFKSEPNESVGLAPGELWASMWNFLVPLLIQASSVSVACLMTRWGRVRGLESVPMSALARVCTLWLIIIVHRFLPFLKRLHITGPDIPVAVVTLLMSIVLNFPDVNSE